MPFKNGRLTDNEANVAALAAKVHDPQYIAEKLGIGLTTVYRCLGCDAVKARILELQDAQLFGEILPLAISAHRELLSDKTPAGARIQAVKLAYEYTIGRQGADVGAKEPHEMTADEIAQAIASLENEAAARAKPIEAKSAPSAPGAGVFD